LVIIGPSRLHGWRRSFDRRKTDLASEESTMRLKDKVAVIIGAGQSAGETLGNGRATVLRFAQEGAEIFAVDRDLASANRTAALARAGR
jgi:hypothetical protein